MRFDPFLIRVVAPLAAGVGLGIGASVAAPSARAQTFAPSQRPKLADGYKRYLVPGQCRSAVRRETTQLWRGPTFRDTLTYAAAVQQEPIPPSALRTAQQCVTQLQSAKLRSDQDVAMVQLTVLAQRADLTPRLVDSVVARAAAESEIEKKYWLVEQLGAAYAGGSWGTEPLRDLEAQARLLALVPCSNKELCYTRRGILHLLRRAARGRDNFALAARYTDSLISGQRQENQLEDAQRDSTGALQVYPRVDYFYMLARRFDDTAAVTDSTSLSAAWERVRNGLREVGENPDNPFPSDEWDIGNRHYFFLDSLFRLGVKFKVPALTPQAWVGPTGPASAPAPGRVVLIINRSMIVNFSELTAMVRRLHTKYAAAGLDVVWIVQSQGNFGGHAVPSFDDERKLLASYWFAHHKIPGVLALDQTTFGKMPDNRIVPQSSTSGALKTFTGFGRRSGVELGVINIIDRNGNLIVPQAIRFEEGGREMEPVLVRMIERALGGVGERKKSEN